MSRFPCNSTFHLFSDPPLQWQQWGDPNTCHVFPAELRFLSHSRCTDEHTVSSRFPFRLYSHQSQSSQVEFVQKWPRSPLWSYLQWSNMSNRQSSKWGSRNTWDLQLSECALCSKKAMQLLYMPDRSTFISPRQLTRPPFAKGAQRIWLFAIFVVND